MCVKCKTSPATENLIQSYCLPCLLAHTAYKFKSLVGKTRTLDGVPRIMIAFSGGPSSLALLHLCRFSLAENAHARFKVARLIVHVDETALFPTTAHDHVDNVRAAAAPFVVSPESDIIIIPLSSVLDSDSGLSADAGSGSDSASASASASGAGTVAGSGSVAGLAAGSASGSASDAASDAASASASASASDATSASSSSSSSPDDALRALFNATRTLTAKQDLLRRLRTAALLRAARDHGCNVLFTGESSTCLAVRVLATCAMGGGAAIPLDSTYGEPRGYPRGRDGERENVRHSGRDRQDEDKNARETNIKHNGPRGLDIHKDDISTSSQPRGHQHPPPGHVRPLKDISAHEITLYLAHHHLTPPNHVTFPDAPRGSITCLTDMFVRGLQSNFPSTVDTIAKTADKIAAVGGKDGGNGTCALCGGEREKGAATWRKRTAMWSLDDHDQHQMPHQMPHQHQHQHQHQHHDRHQEDDLCYSCARNAMDIGQRVPMLYHD